MNYTKINLHCHSNYSDGKKSINQIVVKALKIGLDYLAITDHFTNSWKSRVIPTLNSFEKIDNYLEEISNCQHYLKLHSKNLQLYKGIEIDLGSSDQFIKHLINPSFSYYLILIYKFIWKIKVYLF